MKFQVALAAVVTAEGLSSSTVAAREASTVQKSSDMARMMLGKKRLESLSTKRNQPNSVNHGRFRDHRRKLEQRLVNRLAANKGKQAISFDNSSHNSAIPDIGILGSRRNLQGGPPVYSPVTCPATPTIEEATCNCYSDCLQNPGNCACPEAQDCCEESVVGLFQSYPPYMNRPLAYGASYYCSMPAFVGCRSCGITSGSINPRTGMPDGPYQVEIDCPNGLNLRNSDFDTAEELFGQFMGICENGLCDDCSPVCDSCSTNPIQNTLEMSSCEIATADILNMFYLWETEPTEGGDSFLPYENPDGTSVYRYPLRDLVNFMCNDLSEGDDWCTACQVDEVDGGYNVLMDCPNVPEDTLLPINFAQYCQNYNFCGSCEIDADNFFVDMKSCNLVAYMFGDSTSTSTSPPGDSTSPPGDSTSPPGDSTSPPGDSTSPPGNSTSPPGDSTASLETSMPTSIGSSTDAPGSSTETSAPMDVEEEQEMVEEVLDEIGEEIEDTTPIEEEPVEEEAEPTDNATDAPVVETPASETPDTPAEEPVVDEVADTPADEPVVEDVADTPTEGEEDSSMAGASGAHRPVSSALALLAAGLSWCWMAM